ncbi:MAG: hypothetical protein AVDCRST_MAG60-2603 [uncultured Nocardioides sp.]|uniref:Uncharacterized protein n=1 Tax=uncultured Nocardioides sp. TaxID=198441 RepID=A0A6J4PBL1_9ACTN|nr:MAG: hypothetical protein AVDCRST_MAG60-2603 [uncultured Nocardioides sp.]
MFRRGPNGSTAGGRSGARSENDATATADPLVYEQDWLGDDSVGPGVLD